MNKFIELCTRNDKKGQHSLKDKFEDTLKNTRILKMNERQY